MGATGRLGIGVAVVAALALVIFGVVAATRRTSGRTVEQPQLVSMEESARAMQQAGTTMQTHGQAMLEEGRRTNDQDLITHGDHWLRDGAALIQGGQWMAMNPTSPGSLLTSPAELAAQGSWGELNRNAQAMLHDPSKARTVDVEALRWNGLAMRGEGQNMLDHAQIMTEEAELMIERHGLQGQAATDLRAAAATMRQVGGYLMQNGQGMMDYADRIRRSMGGK